MTSPTDLRRTDLDTLVATLQNDQARKHDIVVPASKLMATTAGTLMVEGGWTELGPDGVTVTDLEVAPSAIMMGGLAEKFGPTGIQFRQYLAHLHGDPDTHYLWAANLNHWLDQHADARYLLRTFTAGPDDLDGAPAYGRSLQADGYKLIDHLDTLMTALEAMRADGRRMEIRSCDLTENRMRVRVSSPDVVAQATAMLDGYRSPYGGQRGEDLPVIFGGFEISNSETGGGAFHLTPVLEVQVCKNGLRLNKHKMRKFHLGAKLEEGQVKWSNETRDRELDLIRAQVRDIVATSLDTEWVQAQADELAGKAQAPVADPVATVERVGKALKWSPGEQADILRFFTTGGLATSGGLMHAVTAMAQEVANPDRAAVLEATGIEVLDLVR